MTIKSLMLSRSEAVLTPVQINELAASQLLKEYTGWPEIVLIVDVKVETIVHAIVFGWISRYGCPKKVVTDQRRQFKSHVYQNMAKLYGIQLARTTAYQGRADPPQRLCAKPMKRLFFHES
ncbi:hypothetical protein EVAR_50283_1 [Eumeta japonica]|uniref:Integrase catalytic domain-containing protein n=1 Tax=Eumeta variegata TaxID=151549 RepID=A0A4C1XTP7_EUMVA|nr:hypothetical protein EVAR_50283_1 [Eumeta japonica]